MSTVLVDRYRLVCPHCGLDTPFMVGAGVGDIHAVQEAWRIHDSLGPWRACPDDSDIIVSKLEVGASPPEPKP